MNNLSDASKRFHINRVAREAEEAGMTVTHGVNHATKTGKKLHYVTIGFEESESQTSAAE